MHLFCKVREKSIVNMNTKSTTIGTLVIFSSILNERISGKKLKVQHLAYTQFSLHLCPSAHGDKK